MDSLSTTPKRKWYTRRKRERKKKRTKEQKREYYGRNLHHI